MSALEPDSIQSPPVGSTSTPDSKQSLSRGAALGTAWQIVRAITYLLWVTVVARQLGPQGYGELAGFMGLATATGTMTGLGLGLVMLLDVPRRAELFGASWLRAMRTALASGTVLTILFVIVAPHVVGWTTTVAALLAIGVSEVLCVPITTLCSYAFQTHERMGWGNAVHAVTPFASLIAALAFGLLRPGAPFETYVLFHAGGSLTVTCLMLFTVHRLLRPVPGCPGPSSVRDFHRGIELSLVRSADIVLNTIDKTLVLRLAGGEIAGIYAVASRLAAALALPIVTLSSAALPQLSRATVKPASADARKLTAQLVGAAVAWGLVATVLMVALGSALPFVLGVKFTAAAELAIHLAPLPLLIGLCSLGCTVLLTSERQRLRLVVQVGGIATLVVASAMLVPVHGLSGSAAAVLITQVATASGLWLTIRATRASVRASSRQTSSN